MFSLSCSGGTPGTVWNIQTKVYAESSLVGVSLISGSVNHYSFGQGTAQYVVNNSFDAMKYYGYGEQTPSLYVQITATNTSTGSLDAQQQAPFAVDTSQYPFDVSQQNYCNFPGLSEYFRLLPGCGASSANNTVNIAPTSSNCTYGLPQFFQPYLPGCGGTGNGVVPQSQTPNQQSATQQQSCNPSNPTQCQTMSAQQPLTENTLNPSNAFPGRATTPGYDNRSMQAVFGIITSAIATFFIASLILKKSTRFQTSYFRTHLKLEGRFCSACGIRLQPRVSFCSRCGEPCPGNKESTSYVLPTVNIRPQTTPTQPSKDDSETNTILPEIDAMKRQLEEMKDKLLKKHNERKKHKETAFTVDSFIVDSDGYEQTKWDAQKKSREP
ncbi:MAG TPA: hypothetical protein VK503_02350 [Candidatus Bathyarchaeia archaeon]|nr:hypothetical protein [Candidatus Bathyarchaeia archaeon]